MNEMENAANVTFTIVGKERDLGRNMVDSSEDGNMDALVVSLVIELNQLTVLDSMNANADLQKPQLHL